MALLAPETAPQADFSVSKFYAYKGPNYYLETAALVCNVALAPNGNTVEYYTPFIAEVFPSLGTMAFERVIDLFAATVMETLRMDIHLPLTRFSVSYDGGDYVLAVQYWDEYVAEDVVELVSSWFQVMETRGKSGVEDFQFASKFASLQQQFDRTTYGGPTISSILEAAQNLHIPFFWLRNEGDFQWGYGKKQVRGRSTVVHTDGIKDTEFTTQKDAVKNFLLDCGFPTPQGLNCFTEDDIRAEVEELGFPLVVKPLAGHKGEGVTTDIKTLEGALEAYRSILKTAEDNGTAFDGALVEQQVYGLDHRLLAVNGKFAAALLRVPAYVVGDGTSTIEELIAKENKRPERRDNARSPLAKIQIDDGLIGYIAIQNLTVDSIPKADERVYLRRVANVSAGGVSVNVSQQIHPANIKLVEDIAKFFTVNCMGIDVLAQDIAKPWSEGNFAIIEINAGPGIFMHIAPAEGGSVDVPTMILRSHFPRAGSERVPIIAGNDVITPEFCAKLYAHLQTLKPDVEFGSVTEEGVLFNGEFFCKNKSHEHNVRLLLRNPKLDFACIRHTKDTIFDYGTFHQGADITILEEAHYAEAILKRDTLPSGVAVEMHNDYIALLSTTTEPRLIMLPAEAYASTPRSAERREDALLEAIKPLLADLICKYD
jgi:cyanophycin synthetase